MTDTPRTHARLHEVNEEVRNSGDDTMAETQAWAFACKLEKELNATTQAFSDYITKSTIEADELKHEIGNLRQHIELLRATK